MSKMTIKGCVIENGELVKYKGNTKNVVIPEVVDKIGFQAFSGCESLVSVTIPDGVTKIGFSAFSECRNLTSVVIPESVTEIESSAFDGCVNLKNVTIPDSVTKIGSGLFGKCKNLADAEGFIIVRGILDSYCGDGGQVVIPAGVTGIGSFAFSRCEGLTDVVIPDSVTSIELCAFSYCPNLIGVSIPDTVINFGPRIFKNCGKLMDADGFVVLNGRLDSYCGNGKELKIPEGVTVIGRSAFGDCSGITRVEIPQGVLSIGERAFNECVNLMEVMIPDSVTDIGLFAFEKIAEQAQIVVPHLPSDVFSTAGEKRAAAWGFLNHPHLYKDCKVLSNYQKTVIAQKKKLLPWIFARDLVEGLAIFEAKGKITSDNFETDFMEPARKANAARCIAWLEELKNEKSGVTDVVKPARKQKEKDPYNPADMKKTWSYEYWNGGEMITSYKGSETEVVVPERIGASPVKKLGDYAFATITKAEMNKPGKRVEVLESIVSVTIPDSVESIGEKVFYGCKNLVRLTIPETVTSIGQGAFWGCAKLADAKGFVIVCNNLDYYCGSGGVVEIPEGIQSIGDAAFSECMGLTKVVIPMSVTRFGNTVFPGIADHGQIVAPSLPLYVFQTSQEKRAAALGYLSNPDLYEQNSDLEEYQKYAIAQRKTLLRIVFAQDLAPGLGVYASKGKLTIDNFEAEYLKPAQKANAVSCIAWLLEWKQKNVTSADEAKHVEREMMKDPYNVTDMKKLWSYGKLEDGTLMITSYKGTETEVVIPERIGKALVTRLDDYTFSVFTKDGNLKPRNRLAVMQSIVSVQIPDSLIDIGRNAFRGCKKLADAQGLVVVGGILAGYDGNNQNVQIPQGVTSIEDGVFEGNWNLETVTIPEGVTYIGAEAFAKCYNLKSVEIPKSVSYIGDGAFNNCDALQEVVIPEGVTAIGKEMFCGCGHLKNVVIPNSLTSIGTRAFKNCGTLREVVIPEGVTDIGFDAFYGCERLKNVIIPGSVSRIGDFAFSKCLTLKSITIPGSVTALGHYVCAGCGHLKNVTIGNGVSTISESAFRDCGSLTAITIPDSVTVIGNSAFGKCESLAAVQLGSSVRLIDKHAFRQCLKLTEITVTDSVTTIEDSAFGRCESLTTVKLGKKVAFIGKNAFRACKNLHAITIPERITVIGEEAFRDCPDLTIHGKEGGVAETYAKENNIPFVAE